MKMNFLKILVFCWLLLSTLFALGEPPVGEASPEPASTAMIASAIVALVYKNKKH